MPETLYTVYDDRGVVASVRCADRASRLSRAGLHVTAVMRGSA